MSQGSSGDIHARILMTKTQALDIDYRAKDGDMVEKKRLEGRGEDVRKC